MRKLSTFKFCFLSACFFTLLPAGKGGGCLFAEELTAALQEKFLLPFLEIRSSQNLQDMEKWNWGGVLYTSRFWKNFPCQIKVGNLTAGGGISKLKDPSLSQSITPFSRARTDVSEITAALPGLSAFKKEISIFGEFAYTDKKKAFSSSKLNFFYNNDDIFPVFSGSQTVRLFKKLEITLASTAGLFTFPENTFNSWFTDSDFYYHEGCHFCINPQVSVKIPHFESLFSFPLYQTPFGKFQTIYKSENKVTLGRTVISCSVFYNEHEKLLTTRDNTIKDMLQAKLGLQTTFPLGIRRPVFLRSGLSAVTSFMLSEKNFDSHKIKLSAGGRLFSLLYSFSLTANSNFSLDTSGRKICTDLESISMQFSNSWYFSKISPEFIMAASLTPSQNYQSLTSSEKLGLNLAFFKNPKITAAGALSFTQKDGESTKQAFSSWISAHWKTKFLVLTGKIAFKTET